MTRRLAFRFLAPCAALLLATAVAALAAPSGDDQVIVPRNSGEPSASPAGLAPSSSTPGLGAWTAVAVIACVGVGGWLLWRGRGLGSGGRAVRHLAIDETRSLGSRQYLVVASYRDKKFLLGVCPGRIDLLSPLPEAPAEKSDNFPLA